MTKDDAFLQVGGPELRGLLLNFDRIWKSGQRPRLAEFLAAANEAPQEVRRRFLIELIKIDLENRWEKHAAAAGDRTHTAAAEQTQHQTQRRPFHPLLLEEYTNKWPELGPPERLPIELVAHEYTVRLRTGDRPSHAHYAQRFPEHGSILYDTLTSIDRRLPPAALPQRPEADAMARDGERTLLPDNFSAEKKSMSPPQNGRPSGPTDDGLSAPDRTLQGPVHATVPEATDKPVGATQVGPTGDSNGPSSKPPLPPDPYDQTMVGGPMAKGGQPARQRFGNYELIEELARGAMGVVYKAQQMKPRRLVAIKMILSGQLASEEEIRRFHVEAEAAGNLKHPNIVTIFESGEIDGQHYFSMDYIEGQSLADLVREKPLDMNRAARYLKTIAEAIHYAHSQNLLHRDLKPSNVLIDLADQPHVTDFGIAKRVEEDSEKTDPGSVLGTPSYMPPEQAQGDHKRIGPCSDVYSLGAILYQLLTGRPPFLAKTVLDTLMQVVHNDPPPPRLLNPDVDRDLETICLKCLEKDPAQRYASAQELADELGRFLRNEPIVARPISTTARVLKWCRRNPATAFFLVTTMMLIAATAVGASIGYVREMGLRKEAELSERRAKAAERDAMNSRDAALAAQREAEDARKAALRAADEAERERLEAEKARVEADRRREEAESAKTLAVKAQKAADAAKNEAVKNLKLANAHRALAERQTELALSNLGVAKRVVQDMLKRFADERLANVPQMDEVRQELLRQAREFFEKLQQDNERLLAETQKSNAAEQTEAESLRREIGETHNLLGEVQRMLRQDGDAEKSFRAAIDAFRTLSQEHAGSPAQADGLLSLLRVHRNLGDLYTDSRRGDQADAEYKRALDFGRQLTKRHPENPEYEFELARTYNSLFILRNRPGSRTEAREALQQSLELHRAAVDHLSQQLAGDPEADETKQDRLREYRQKLALAYSNLGKLDEDVGQVDKAIENFTAAIAIQQELIESVPEDRNYREDIGRTRNNLARSLTTAERYDEAVAECRRALDLFQSLARDFSAVPDYRYQLGWAYNTSGQALLNSKKIAEAETALNEAVQQLQVLIESYDDPRYRHLLSIVHTNLGYVHSRLQPPDLVKTGEDWNAARTLQEALVGEFPADPAYRASLVQTCMGLAELHLYEAQTKGVKAQAAAKAAIDRAMELLEELRKEFPKIGDYRTLQERCRELLKETEAAPAK